MTWWGNVGTGLIADILGLPTRPIHGILTELQRHDFQHKHKLQDIFHHPGRFQREDARHIDS